jgi:hypothetical protein
MSVKFSSGLNRGIDANGHVETVGKVVMLIKLEVVPLWRRERVLEPLGSGQTLFEEMRQAVK